MVTPHSSAERFFPDQLRLLFFLSPLLLRASVSCAAQDVFSSLSLPLKRTISVMPFFYLSQIARDCIGPPYLHLRSISRSYDPCRPGIPVGLFFPLNLFASENPYSFVRQPTFSDPVRSPCLIPLIRIPNCRSPSFARLAVFRPG